MARRAAKAFAAHNGNPKLAREHTVLEEMRGNGGFAKDMLKEDLDRDKIDGPEWRALVRTFEKLKPRCSRALDFFRQERGEKPGKPCCSDDLRVAERAIREMAPLAVEISNFVDERREKVPAMLQRLTITSAFMIVPFRALSTSHRTLAVYGPAESRRESWAEVVEYATAAVQMADVTFTTRFAHLMPAAQAAGIIESNYAHAAYAYSMRGEAFGELGDFGAALVDHRAALAALRMGGDGSEEAPSLDWVAKLALVALTMQRRDTPRPHFSAEERDRLERELGLRAYAPECWVCATCGVAAAAAKLAKCARCERAWYCSKRCQKKDYKGGHKDRCPSKFQARCSLLDEGRDMEPLEADLVEQGYRVIYRRGPGLGGDPVVVLRDPATGELYEALSDQEVCYLGDFKAKHGLSVLDSGLGNCTETGHDLCCEPVDLSKMSEGCVPS